jgi:hypothetical protein
MFTSDFLSAVNRFKRHCSGRVTFTWGRYHWDEMYEIHACVQQYTILPRHENETHHHPFFHFLSYGWPILFIKVWQAIGNVQHNISERERELLSSSEYKKEGSKGGNSRHWTMTEGKQKLSIFDFHWCPRRRWCSSCRFVSQDEPTMWNKYPSLFTIKYISHFGVFVR